MVSGADRFIPLDKHGVIDPEQVDGIECRRGTVTLHLRSGRAMYVVTNHVEPNEAEWAIAEVMAMLYPAPPDPPQPKPPAIQFDL